MSQRSTMQPGQQLNAVQPISGVLQRKCATCGNHTMAGGECAACHKNQSASQRNPASAAAPGTVQEMPHALGQSFEPDAGAFIATGFGHNFSRVKAREKVRSISSPTAYHREMPIPLSLDVSERRMTPDLQQIVSGLGPGSSLPSSPLNPLSTQRGNPMGPALEMIRIHDNRQSHATAALFNSEAFAVGNHIVLGDPQRARAPRPWLVAHEVAHTLQQRPQTPGVANGDHEREADRFADRVVTSPTEKPAAIAELTPASVGLARRVILKHIQDLPGDLLLIIDVDDGDFVGGCVRAIVPHAGVKLIKKHPHTQLFNLHVGFLTNAAGEFCIFFYESVSGICEMKCFPSKEALEEAWEEITDWLVEMLKKVFKALAILALILAAVVLAYLIAQAIVAALALLALA